MDIRCILVFGISTLSSLFGQSITPENAGANIASLLMECYNNTAIPGITIADIRPPSTVNLLIEYIRKLEDANPTMSAQQLSLQIIERIRQDGIAPTRRTIDDRIALPFSPRRLERYKFQVLLTQLLPNVVQTLNFGDLGSVEKCALHYMISNSIDDHRRDNEATECSRSARYTSRVERRRRDIEKVDVESVSSFAREILANVSQCPIELGVVYSQFGTIKTGNVLAGIATGMNKQILTSGVDNRYAGTIAGELGEVALYQARSNIVLGSSGGWNSSINPKYLFLQTNNNLQATDAELRGALDGLYMALKMDNWRKIFADIKISQILDMYYSPNEKGVLDDSLKACNRNILYTELTSQDTMNTQLLNFMPILNDKSVSGVSVATDSFGTLTSAAVSAFQTYLPTLATSDLQCTGTQEIMRVVSDLHIFVDVSWSYSTVQPLLSYILNNIDVNVFNTRYAIYGATSLQPIINTTNYLSDFYTSYNQSIHNNEQGGFDYINVFQKVEFISTQKLDNNTYTAGESTIFLFVTKTSLNDDQRNFLSTRKQIINRNLPYINFLVFGSGAQSDYSVIVSNPVSDVVIISETSSEEQIKSVSQNMVKNIKNIPRSIINSACTSQFSGGTSTLTITDYVELKGSNYYRISPNYFYTGGGTRNLKLKGQNSGSMAVCISRDNVKPDNQSANCQTISNDEYTQDITKYCDGSSVGSCSPIFMSITGLTSSVQCGDTLCRFPNDIKYTITLENVGCSRSKSTTNIPASILLVVLSTYLYMQFIS